ncbi:MAG: hypothetical protein LH480_10410 [Rubrivivax sp.]|nr:hypothetical protein [Rubrivivax sp.]
MHRRHLLTLPLLGALPVWAHHGWSSLDQNRPIYLEGKLSRVAWRNPHAELELELPAAGQQLPPDLASRALPAQSAPVDGPALLKAAQLPTRKDRRWQIELAPLSRLQAWQVPELKVGDAVSLIGFTFSGEQGAAVLRAEYLFAGGKVYGLRSSPA